MYRHLGLLKDFALKEMPYNTHVQSKYVHCQTFENQVDFDDSLENGAIFSCPNDKCTLEFLRYDRLEKHLMSDQCKIKVPVISIENRVRSMYLSAFGVGFSEKN